jgi:hypothetical protein
MLASSPSTFGAANGLLTDARLMQIARSGAARRAPPTPSIRQIWRAGLVEKLANGSLAKRMSSRALGDEQSSALLNYVEIDEVAVAFRPPS